MRWTRHGPASVVTLLVVMSGCATPEPGPRIELVQPTKGYFGEDTKVSIIGRDFFPEVVVLARGGATTNDVFEAEIIDGSGALVAPLGVVDWIDTEHVEGFVPSGLEPGSYGLRLRDPTGVETVRNGAYTVTSTRADRLVVTEDWGEDDAPAYYRIHQEAPIVVRLLEADGALFNDDDVSIRLEVRTTSGDPLDVAFGGALELALVEQRIDRIVLDGQLSGGVASIPMTLQSPAKVIIEATVTDESLTAVDKGTYTQDWLPGLDRRVQVDLVHGTDLVAGESVRVRMTLLDDEGNLVESPEDPVTLLVTDACGDVNAAVSNFSGSQEHEFELRRATESEACSDRQSITARIGSTPWESTEFDVRAASMTAFDVDIGSSIIEAGATQNAVVRPIDRFGNLAVWSGSATDLRVYDSLPEQTGHGVCGDGERFVLCSVVPTIAASRVRLIAEDNAGTRGESALYSVQAAELAEIVIRADSVDGQQVAGEPFDVLLSLYDRFGNDADGSALGKDDLSLVDEFGDIVCDWIGPAERGQVLFSCEGTVATPTVVLTALGPKGVRAQSGGFPLVNSELESVFVTTGGLTVEAGAPLAVRLVAFDAFGNLYTEQSEPNLSLDDATGTLSPGQVSLSADGTVDLAVNIEAAGSTSIRVLHHGRSVGSSGRIDVQPSVAHHLDVGVQGAWHWVDTTAKVNVVARDAYNNVALLNDRVVLKGKRGTFGTTTGTLVDGFGTVVVEWFASDTNETLEVVADTGPSGEQDDLIVVQDCPGSNPSLRLEFGGAFDAVACHDGVEAVVTGDFDESTAFGAHSLALRVLSIDQASRESSATNSVEVPVSQFGTFETRGLLVQDDGCAVETIRQSYVGLNDGKPVGPIAITIDAPVLPATTGSTTVSVKGVSDCEGNAAALSSLHLRTDRGSLSGLASTKKGLAVSLDSNGDGTGTLDLSATSATGVGTVYASVHSRAARGAATFTVTGDRLRPVVYSQDPTGRDLSEIDVVSLRFSEDMRASSLTPSAFELKGPTSVSVSSVSVDGPYVELLLDDTIDGSAGQWTLTVDKAVQDASGRALDGEWNATNADYSMDFGAVSSVVPTISACSVSPATFRPDGDNYVGIEADESGITVTGSSKPETWILSVFDGSGRLVTRERTAGTASSPVLVWDGRDSTEMVVRDGTYRMEVVAQNAEGTEGAACWDRVVVDNSRNH